MPKEVIMPALGMSQDTGRLIAWLKEPGTLVEKGEPIMEIETDKTTVEVDAPASGTLANVRAQAGDDVPVGDVIAVILAPGEEAPAPPEAAAPSPETSSSATNSDSERSATPVAVRVAAAHDIDISQVPSKSNRVTRADVEAHLSQVQDRTTSAADGRVLASPKARRLAAERGVELKTMVGSGPQGAVLAEDVLAYHTPENPVSVESVVDPASAPPPAQTGTMWKRMAERLTESWQTVPHFYLKRDVAVTELIAWRKNAIERSPVKVTYTDLLVKLVASALRSHPFVNGTWTERGVMFNEQINVGLAVAVDEGLLVPVIHDADQLGLLAIAEGRQELVSRATEGKLKPDDLQGGTFTISNLGMFDIDEFEAIVNPPQAAILAVGRIFEKAMPVNGTVEIVPTMTLRLSCDHRAVDGARGARFMDTLVKSITDPLSLID